MRAVYYERQGAAEDVLVVGDRPTPTPGAGEVRVRLAYSGVNPGDTKKRLGFFGSVMPYPVVVPHSDGSGVIDAVGEGVDAGRVGRRVWVYNAQSYRPFGTAAEYTVVPDVTAVDLPENVDDVVGATLGIPGITAHRAVFADGPVEDLTVLVHGARGAVGSMAAQLAAWAGARVLVTVRKDADLAGLDGLHVDGAVSLESADPLSQLREHAPDGVDRVVEVAFSDNVDLDAQLLRNGGVLAAYATREPRPSFDFWKMLFDNITIRLLGSDDFPGHARQAAAEDLTAAAADGALTIPVAEPLPLEQAAAAHDQVDRDNRRRVVLRIPG